MRSSSAHNNTSLHRLTAHAIGEARADFALTILEIEPSLLRDDESVSRAELAMALNACLFVDLLDRVPTAARYVAEVAAENRAICFDHGALRTIDGETGELPRGIAAFERFLEPLGYIVGGIYPLPRLNMTGRAFVHQDLPQSIPQFFVSELHISQLPEAAQSAANAIFSTSRDPLDDTDVALLKALTEDRQLPYGAAADLLRKLISAFGRQHSFAKLSDYEALLPHSAEGAWIATEGNAFNHATDRVADVDSLAADLRAQGLPMKDAVEVSANGRVRQTALRADQVQRDFRFDDDGMTKLNVPGSFYEFITRSVDPDTGQLDLTFDSGNATGIFAMTRRA